MTILLGIALVSIPPFSCPCRSPSYSLSHLRYLVRLLHKRKQINERNVDRCSSYSCMFTYLRHLKHKLEHKRNNAFFTLNAQVLLPGHHPRCACVTCSFLWESQTSYTFFTTNEARKITDSLSCHSKNLIYLIECKKCHLQYIGETKRQLNERFGEHRRSPWSWITNSAQLHHVSLHFKQAGHSIKAETHDATNRGDTSRRQVASSVLLLRQDTCSGHAREFGRGKM